MRFKRAGKGVPEGKGGADRYQFEERLHTLPIGSPRNRIGYIGRKTVPLDVSQIDEMGKFGNKTHAVLTVPHARNLDRRSPERSGSGATIRVSCAT